MTTDISRQFRESVKNKKKVLDIIIVVDNGQDDTSSNP